MPGWMYFFFSDYLNSSTLKRPLVPPQAPPPCWIGLLQPIKQQFAAHCCSNAALSPLRPPQRRVPIRTNPSRSHYTPIQSGRRTLLISCSKPAGWKSVEPPWFAEWMSCCFPTFLSWTNANNKSFSLHASRIVSKVCVEGWERVLSAGNSRGLFPCWGEF